MSEVDAPVLVSMPVSQIVTFWRPGSHDWSWADEYADLMGRDAEKTAAIERRALAEGWGFIDAVSPVLLSSGGRVWDGHHRICLAIKHGTPSLMVEMVSPRPYPRMR